MLALLLLSSLGATPAHLVVSKEHSEVSLAGDSTLHRYGAKANTFALDAQLDELPLPTGEAMAQAVRDGELSSLELRVPVRALKSGESALDENLWKTLNADRAPQIRFRMQSCQPLPSSDPAVAMIVHLKGTLEIAGVERDVAVDGRVTVLPSSLRVRGTKVLKMSDFGVKPPVLMGGLIKTDDAITLLFDLELIPAPGS